MRVVVLALAAMLSAGGLLGGCGSDDSPAADLAVPESGLCRDLTPEDVAKPADDTEPVPVPCSESHTAETYAVGELPDEFEDAEYDDTDLDAWAYETCSKGFREFIGADVSLMMRTVLSWAWFRPSAEAWDDGARWYRCDVIGGGEQSKSYVALPTTAKDLLRGPPQDEWMVCGDGDTVASAAKVPCDQPHDWRAVTTISVGEPGDDYPGDRTVEVTTRDYCSKSVGAWLNYPVDYDYGYTWFHEDEWDAGNRRSVCWAKTAE